MNSRRICLILLLVLLFLSGLGISLYPLFHGAFVDHTLHKDAKDFLIRTEPAAATEAPVPHETIFTAPAQTEPTLYPDLLEDMIAYNEMIFTNGQSDLSSPLAYEQPSFILADYGLQSEIIGVVSIPKLEIKLPIYLGATSSHINNGVAHMSQTSLPIGGNNTNCVIAGHRGWDGALFFRYITDLEYGDLVTVTNLWETLTYQVVEVKIIEPHEVEQILIRPGRDLVTLLTCHPYASGGKQRYLVICERTEHE